MTTDQVLFGVGLILVLAVGSQVLASRLRIPALIILLPAGFIAGAITSDVNPQRLLGAAFQPLVSLAVAVILYDAGLALDLGKLRGHTRRVVRRLIIRGVPVTWAFGAVFAGLLLGMSAGAALMLGAILVVSGPTVVGPLLRFIRPTERLERVLAWEGSLIDPVGGILGAVVFHAVMASSHATVRTDLTRGNACSPAGWPRAASWPRPPHRRSALSWRPTTSAALPRSSRSPSWSSWPQSPSTA